MRKRTRTGTPNHNSSSGKSGRSSSGLGTRDRSSFTRSRSPAMPPPIDIHNGSVPYALSSPSFMARYRQVNAAAPGILPLALEFKTRVLFSRFEVAFYMDTRKAGESVLLMLCLLYGSQKLSGSFGELMGPDDWISWGSWRHPIQCMSY